MTNPQQTLFSALNNWKHFSKIRNKIRVPSLATIIQHSFGSPSHNNQRRKRNKKNLYWKKRSKTLTICRWLDIYIENSKNSTGKLLELINEYSKVSGYKINKQKSLAFLYTNNENLEREVKETIPFTIATTTKKYLGINLPKDTKDLNYKTLMKEIKDDTKRWRDKESILWKWLYYAKQCIDSMLLLLLSHFIHVWLCVTP